VLGISVDFNAANQAWAEKLGLTYPLLSDARRTASRAYGVLNDDPTAANDPRRIAGYLRSKRAWFIVDKSGIVRYVAMDDPRGLVPTEELIEVLKRHR
jgi:peroxiredoxin